MFGAKLSVDDEEYETELHVVPDEKMNEVMIIIGRVFLNEANFEYLNGELKFKKKFYIISN